MFQLMPVPLTVPCFSKIQIGFAFLVPAHLGSPGKRAVKWVCVCVRKSSLLRLCFCSTVSYYAIFLWDCKGRNGGRKQSIPVALGQFSLPVLLKARIHLMAPVLGIQRPEVIAGQRMPETFQQHATMHQQLRVASWTSRRHANKKSWLAD